MAKKNNDTKKQSQKNDKQQEKNSKNNNTQDKINNNQKQDNVEKNGNNHHKEKTVRETLKNNKKEEHKRKESLLSNKSKESKKEQNSHKEQKDDDDSDFESFPENQEEENELQEAYNRALKNVENKSSFIFDDQQMLSAVKCLKTLLDKAFENNMDIFARKEEEMLQINILFSALPLKYSPRPVVLPVKLDLPTIRKVCVIIKDEYAKLWKEYNTDFSTENFEVDAIKYSDLKLEYVKYEQKRNLVKRFDIFICDKSLYHMLPKVLGREFYSAKKFPFAVELTNGQLDYVEEEGEKVKDLKKWSKGEKTMREKIIETVTNASFYMSNGPNYTVKTGYLSEEKAEILVKKAKSAIKSTLAHIMKWGVSLDSLKAISFKFTNSVDLPIFNQLTDDEVKAYHSVIEEKKKKDSKDKESKDTKETKISKQKNKNK